MGKNIRTISPEYIDALKKRAWKGNVRELRIADLDKLPGLKDTEQFRLQVESHFPDLIQEDRTSGSFLKQAFCLFQSTGKSPRFMTEHLAFQ